MIDMLQQYSITDIIVFTVFLALAIKGIISFFDWVKERATQHFKAKEDQDRQEVDQNDKINSILESQNAILAQIHEMRDIIDILEASDRDAIKSYITKEYKYYTKEGWIDDYSLEILEKRFHHYELEGGNSFILKLMEELRALPHRMI